MSWLCACAHSRAFQQAGQRAELRVGGIGGGGRGVRSTRRAAAAARRRGPTQPSGRWRGRGRPSPPRPHAAAHARLLLLQAVRSARLTPSHRPTWFSPRRWLVPSAPLSDLVSHARVRPSLDRPASAQLRQGVVTLARPRAHAAPTRVPLPHPPGPAQPDPSPKPAVKSGPAHGGSDPARAGRPACNCKCNARPARAPPRPPRLRSLRTSQPAPLFRFRPSGLRVGGPVPPPLPLPARPPHALPRPHPPPPRLGADGGRPSLTSLPLSRCGKYGGGVGWGWGGGVSEQKGVQDEELRGPGG